MKDVDEQTRRDAARERLTEAGPVVVLRRSYEEEPPSEAELAAIEADKEPGRAAQ